MNETETVYMPQPVMRMGHVPRPPDAIVNARIAILARCAAHARGAANAIGWHNSLLSICPPTLWRRPWPERGRLYPPRLVVSDEMPPELLLADGADFVLVVSRRKGQMWIDTLGCEHEPRSGLMRRIRAGIVAPHLA